MFKKMFVTFISFALSAQFAFANQQAGLNEAYNEFKYSMTVEWDQQNEDFAAKQSEAFFVTINELGVSKAELVSFIMAELKDDAARSYFKTIVNKVNPENMSAAELKALVADSMKGTSLRGASWNGEGEAAGVVLAVFFIVFFVYMIDREYYRSSNTCLFCS